MFAAANPFRLMADVSPNTSHATQDPFGWLEDRDSAATRSFLLTEDGHFQGYFRRHAGLQEQLKARARELMSVDTVDLPVSDGNGGLLYLRRCAEQQQKVLHRRTRDGKERCIVAPANCGDSPHISITPMLVSPDGRYLVIGVRDGGGDAQVIRFYDLDHEYLLDDRLASGLFRGVVFTEQRDGVYYSVEDEAGPYSKVRAVRKHVFGSPSIADKPVHIAGEDLELRLLLRGSEDGLTLGYLHVLLRTELESHLFIQRVGQDSQPRLLTHQKGGIFSPTFDADCIYALSTIRASNGKVERCMLTPALQQEWTVVLPEETRRLRGYQRKDWLEVIHYDDAGSPSTRVRNLNSKLDYTITYPPDGSVVVGQTDLSSGRLFYSFSAPTQPDAIYCVDLHTGKHETWWEPSMRALPAMSVEETSLVARDGHPLPVTLIRPVHTAVSMPVVLNAYGFGSIPIRPRFSVLVVLLIEHGFVCAVAEVRNGSDVRSRSSQNPDGDRNQISVDDLIDAANWLVNSTIAASGKVALAGQSFGALLMLCAATQRPWMFRAVLAVAPLTDLIRFHLYGVARGFVTALGSPDDPEDRVGLAALSPYHRLQADTDYPAMYFVSGHRDLRCDGMHARKMVARLRYEIQTKHALVLDYKDVRGHKPVLPLDNRIEGIANRACFLIAELQSTREDGDDA